MNFSFTKRFGILYIALMMVCMNAAMAQCDFSAFQYSGCQGNFSLGLTDITPGVTCPGGGIASTNWMVIQAAGCSPDTLYGNRSCQFAALMNCPGIVTVIMTDTVNGVPCTVSKSNISVYPKPILAGHFSATSACIGDCVYWNDASSPGVAPGLNCSPLSYQIDWNNGDSFSVIPTQCATYSAYGTYSPTIVITNSCGCLVDTTFHGAITIAAPPSAAFTGNPLSSCTSPLVSTMTATSPLVGTTYSWYINNGSGFTLAQSTTSSTFVHSYTTGTYDIKLITVNGGGCGDTSVQLGYVSAGTYVAASFTSSDTSGCNDKLITFIPSPPGQSQYTWSITGGAPGAVVPSSATYFTNQPFNPYFYNSGSYTVQLIVKYAGPGGCIDTVTKINYINLGRLVPATFIVPDSQSCQVPATICANYTGSGCSNCTFSWTPLPNSTPNGQTGTCYTFTAYGQYTPELNITDSGCTNTVIRNNYINISPLNVCARKTYPHGGCANDTILVTNCSTGGPFSNVIWNFPGGNLVSSNSTSAQVIYPGSGCNKYTMIIQTPSGCIDTLRDSICIGIKPTITMSVGPHDLCYEAVPNIFTVTSISASDTPTSVTVWPEGIKGGAPTFIVLQDTTPTKYIYQDYGNFAFCYLATKIGCPGDTTCLILPADSVHIFPPKTVISMTVPCTNSDSVIFTNQSMGADSSVWHFNGMDYPNQHTLTAIFPQCGVKYGVSLTAYAATDTNPYDPLHLAIDTVHCMLTVADTVSRPCYGTDFKFSNTTGCYYAYQSEANTFYTLPLNVVDTPINVMWSTVIDPGSPVFSNYQGSTIPVYSLYLSGQYDACVQLKYSNGCIDTLCKPKYIDVSQPIAYFQVSDSAGCVPFCVQFTDSSYVHSGAIAKHYWTFGDTAGVVDSIHASPNHCFNSVGQFQVTLTIVDTNGCTSVYNRQIQANTIHANFTETDSITCTTNPSPLNPVTYTNSSTGFVSSYQWILPTSLGVTPAGMPTTPSITEQYGNQGYDSIGLVVVDQFGTCRDTIFKPIHVVNPIANYSIDTLSDTFSICPPLVINPFRDSSLNDICFWSWNFGDGSAPATSQNPPHIYTLPGTYPVTETVTSCHGCVDSITKLHIVIQGPVVRMSVDKEGGCPCLPVNFYITSYNTDHLHVIFNGSSFTDINVSPRGSVITPALDTVTFTYCTVGDENPSIIAVDNTTGCQVVYNNLIAPIAIDSPTANFSYTRVCGSDSICFSNLTTFASSQGRDSIDSWDFGDGTTSSQHSSCHVYPGPGNYTVSLTVSDQFLCTNSITKNIHVSAPPVASFIVNDSVGCIPFLVQFSDTSSVDDSTTIGRGYWEFGNGTVSGIFVSPATGDTFYNYTLPGTYIATLVITDGFGCTDSASHTISAQIPPTINASPAVSTICLGDTTTLTGSGSAPLAWITTYNISDTSSPNPRVWPRVDTMYILSVGTPNTCFVYDTVYVHVSTISISLDTAINLCRNELTAFSASAQSTHATISTYVWSFGDGSSPQTGQTQNHQYSTFGSYTDTLIVTNSIGCKDTDITPITIFDIPNAALSVSDTVICLGTPITITNLSTAGASAGLSTFYFDVQPDGTPDYTASPATFTYSQAGSYHVLLVQADLNQCVDSAEKAVIVHALPTANFNNDTSCIQVGNSYSSTTQLGDGPITSYNWTIDGSTVGIDSPTIYHTFTDSGTNIICLKVTDVFGCVSDTCKPVVIFQNPHITVTPLDATLCVGYSDTFIVSGSRFDHIQWVPSAWVSNPTGDTVVITPKQTIRYQVYGYYLQCQPAIDTVSIYVIDTVPISATADPENIVLGLSSNVTSTVEGTIDSIVWDPDSTLNCRKCRNPIATPSQTTTYYATVYYSHNGVTCSNRTSVTITVYQSCGGNLIYMPNTFTPNGDGKNDAFRIRGQGISQVNYFRVYDRWGKLVYQANDVEDPDQAAWNGCLHNDLSKPENSGVYVYVFEVQCVTGNTVTGKGNITLIR
jgi:gliding motility-associated-like protein